MKHRLFSLLAAIFVLSYGLSGCNKQGPLDIEEAIQGGYEETELSLPEVNSIVALDQAGDQMFYLLGKQAQTATRGPWEVWVSHDSCRNWQQKGYTWVNDIGDISCAAFSAEGLLYACVHEPTLVELSGIEPEMRSLAVIYVGDEDGLQNTIELEAEELLHFSVSSGNLFLAITELHQYNLESNQYILTYPLLSVLYPGIHSASGNYLAVAYGKQVNIYDMDHLDENPKAIETPGETDGEIVAIAMDIESETVYYCDTGGIYRLTMDGSITEQLVNGNHSILGASLTAINKLFIHSDGAFTVYIEKDYKPKLYRYEFQTHANRLPEQELTLFYLYENGYIQAVCDQYRMENPEISITYRVGVTVEDTITSENALANLQIELAAGRGPDIVVLDGMPIEYMLRQGWFADLSILTQSGLWDEVFSNIASIYGTDGFLPAVATRFYVPMLGGDVTHISSLNDMAQALEDWEQPLYAPYMYSFDEWTDGMEIDCTLMERLYDVCTFAWISDDGEVVEHIIEQDLLAIQRMKTAYLSATGRYSFSFPTLLREAPVWIGGGSPFMFGNMLQTEHASFIYSAVNQNEGSVQAYPGIDGGLFSPMSLLSINSHSENAELAMNFVEFSLSTEMQAKISNNGIPVNQFSLEQIWVLHDPGSDAAYSDISNFSFFQSTWLSEEEYREFVALLDTLNTPIQQDAMIKQIILRDTQDYLNSIWGLEETVALLSDNLYIYLVY